MVQVSFAVGQGRGAADDVASLLGGAGGVFGGFDAQAQAERFDDEAEARKAGVSVFGEGSVEGFSVEAGGFGG
ncbi:MAG: hypothetical protein PVH21_18160 [Myxococcales bacterium]|jgi:hypothetical protein